MGWSFRKSINIGPLRVNLSKSGIGASIGAGGVRRGVTAKGKAYTSINLPGSGLTYRTSAKRGGLSIIVLGAIILALVWLAIVFLKSAN